MMSHSPAKTETGPSLSMSVHIHLDPVGGIAGDMFAAAMLNAMPEHALRCSGRSTVWCFPQR